MNKGNLNFHNNVEKDGVFDQSKNNSFWNAWTLNMGQTYCPETSITRILRRVTSKKSEGLNYTAAEAWNVSTLCMTAVDHRRP